MPARASDGLGFAIRCWHLHQATIHGWILGGLASDALWRQLRIMGQLTKQPLNDATGFHRYSATTLIDHPKIIKFPSCH